MMNQFTLMKKWQSNISSVCIFLKVNVGDAVMDVIKDLKKEFQKKEMCMILDSWEVLSYLTWTTASVVYLLLAHIS